MYKPIINTDEIMKRGEWSYCV